MDHDESHPRDLLKYVRVPATTRIDKCASSASQKNKFVSETLGDVFTLQYSDYPEISSSHCMESGMG